MDFTVEFLSFFVIQTEGSDKHFKHYKTLDRETYADSEIKHFLDGEFTRIIKRKVEKHPNSEQAPTKIGRFIVEPGYDVGSNPNFSLFHRLRTEPTKDYYFGCADELVRTYMDTSAVRGGALIIARARAERISGESFVFVMKCDFEPKIARISDEHSLISQVEMAISAKNMKSIQYPHMPEEGMLEQWELKVHQASHARYFEDFLKFVSYEKSMPELISHQVLDMVQEYMENKWQGEQGGRGGRGGSGGGQGAGNAGGSGGADNGAWGTGADGGWGPGTGQGAGGQDDWGAEGHEVGQGGTSGSGVEGNGEDRQGGAGAGVGAGAGAGDGEGAAGGWGVGGGAEREGESGAEGYLSHGGAYAVSGETAAEPYDESPVRVPSYLNPEQAREAKEIELWAASDKRNLQEKWSPEQVMEASQRLIEEKPELELKFKLDDTLVKAKLSDFGDTLHIARVGGRYVVVLEGDAFQFAKGFSPVELLQPEELEDVVRKINERPAKPNDFY